MIKMGMFCLSLLMLAQVASAAGFDCTKASTKVEKLICADSDLSILDSALSGYYWLALLTNKKLKSTQKDWLKERNKCLDKACLQNSYSERIITLKKSIKAGIEEMKLAENKKNISKVDHPYLPFEGFWCSSPCYYAGKSMYAVPCKLDIHNNVFKASFANGDIYDYKYSITEHSKESVTLLLEGGGTNSWYTWNPEAEKEWQIHLKASHGNQLAKKDLELTYPGGMFYIIRAQQDSICQ